MINKLLGHINMFSYLSKFLDGVAIQRAVNSRA